MVAEQAFKILSGTTNLTKIANQSFIFVPKPSQGN